MSMSDKQVWDASQHRRLKESVYEQLREEIVELRLPPGTSLRELELANRLKVSKTPLREALVKLQEDKLVEIVPYRGAVVSSYGAEDLREIYELRELLEGACAREAAITASARDLGELNRIVHTSEAALASGDADRLAQLFDEFDAVMYAQTRNRRVRGLLDNLQAHLKRIGKLTVGIPGRADASVVQHLEIYEAILQRDALEAERRMRYHIVSVMTDQLATFTGEAELQSPPTQRPRKALADRP